MIKKVLGILFFLAVNICSAQTYQAEMADNFRAEGKIYVVISVIAIIFISLVLFLVYIERKISGIEKKLNNTQKVQ
jgi:uncharacterized membrane protein